LARNKQLAHGCCTASTAGSVALGDPAKNVLKSSARWILVRGRGSLFTVFGSTTNLTSPVVASSWGYHGHVDHEDPRGRRKRLRAGVRSQG
jgi:hypothetical protein